MTVVIDASVAFAGLVNGGDDSRWAFSILAEDDTVAPELLLVEVAHIARRAVLAGTLSSTEAWTLIDEAREIIPTFLPHSSLLERVWELHPQLTSYDATYVALAEKVGAPLATLDRRLARAHGPTCSFLIPD